MTSGYKNSDSTHSRHNCTFILLLQMADLGCEDQDQPEVINRSTFDVQEFCQKHAVCKQCNEVCVDPVMLPCLHTYCSLCLSAQRRNEDSRGERKEAEKGAAGEGDAGGGVLQEEQIEVHNEANGEEGNRQHNEEQEIEVIQRNEDQIIARDNEEEVEIQTQHSESDDSDNEVRNKEADVQGKGESCVPHIIYGNENLSCPHDCARDAGVQVNQPLSNIIQAAKLKEKLPQGEIKCENCEINTAYWICNDQKCGNMPLCERCYEQHGIDKRSKHHQVVKIDPEKDWWRILNRHTWYCSKHPDYLVDMYCPRHDKVVCHKCCTIDHHSRKCKVKDVDEFYANSFDERLERLQKVEELNDKFKAALHIGETIKRSLDTKCDNAIKVVNDRYQHLIDQLTNERDEAIAKANSICDLKKKEIDDHQETLKCVTETLEESLSFVKDYSEIANPTEYMFLKTQLNQRLDDLHEHYSKFDLLPADDDELLLKLSNEDLPRIMLGEVYSTPCVKMFKYDCHQDSAVITVKCCDISGGHVSLRVLPELKAVITTRNGSIAYGIKCKVKPDRSNGQYKISLPFVRGKDTIHIFQPRPYPHNQYYIKGGPISS